VGDYRLFLLDAQDHVSRALVLECDDDEQAIAEAGRSEHDGAMELWQGARVVKRFESDRR